VETASLDNQTELSELVRRLVARDPAAEEEIVRRYERGVSIIIDQVVRSDSVTADLSQDTFRIVFEKVRRGDLRESERFSGFVRGVARNLAIDYVRTAKKKMQEELGEAEQIPDPAPNQLEAVLRDERCRVVRQVISELKMKRDREVLFRCYVAEDDKDQICADLSLTRPQFNNVISRATARFRELYVRATGEQEK
jgi:RNA polymerase sigma-70 factor (ECF subfamily)